MKNIPILKLNAEQNFLSLIVSFAENSCYSFGFTSKESHILSMAAEEIFVYLCKINKGCEINVSSKDGLYFVELSFQFSAKKFNPKAFNITSNVNIDDEKSLDEMGLMITSRIVDSFSMNEEGSNIVISLLKYRSYPEFEFPEFDIHKVVNPQISLPDKQEVQLLAALLNKYEKTIKLDQNFHNYLLLADMIETGDMKVRVLKSENGLVAGGIFWKKMGKDTVELFGPYIYQQDNPEKLSALLVDNCIETIAKENFKGLLCRFPGDYFPANSFEIIGNNFGRNIYFRQLKEDIGAVSWIHPMIKEYVSKKYSDLFLPREIITVHENENTNNEYSVISTSSNRPAQKVVMHPIIFGNDFADSIDKHLQLFKEEKYSKIIFEIDLGISQHSMFVPVLISNGFEPKFILPCGGRGDLLIFAYKNKAVEKL